MPKKRINPRRETVSAQSAAETADRAFYCAIANIMDSVAETGRLDLAGIGELWAEINSTADRIAAGETKPDTVLSTVESAGLKLGRIKPVVPAPRTAADATGNAKSSYKLACAIMLYTLLGRGEFEREELRQLWERAQYKKDSIDRHYVTLEAVCEALREEYGISVGTGHLI